ncbi:S-adenosyl-L-methionine-dependent methyltransferase [Xylaria sp. FL0043]|nr:S-adenosyl-L-methionine-dependent methyltransferase [Xylaria sp. FL0043]
MSDLLEGVKQLLKESSGPSKRDILTQLHELIVSVETAEETITRVALYPLQTSVAKIGQDLRIFETLTNSGTKSVQELQVLTNAHPITLARILRYMASVGLIREVGPDLFEANNFENGGPLFQAMPTFLRDNKYQDVADGKPTVHQVVYNTDKDTYDWLSEHPEKKFTLVKFMALEQAVRDSWLDKYPVERETQSWTPAMPVFVDVGGNVGHSCALFKKRFPEVPGRVILQDLPATIEHALQTPGVETMGHSFFEEQPIKGSNYYHLESVLLINDMILPDSEVPMFPDSLDILILCAFGSRERTMKEWQN